MVVRRVYGRLQVARSSFDLTPESFSKSLNSNNLGLRTTDATGEVGGEDECPAATCRNHPITKRRGHLHPMQLGTLNADNLHYVKLDAAYCNDGCMIAHSPR